MLGEVQRLAVDGDRHARPHPAVKLLKFGPARMARHVDQMGAIGDHLDALTDQSVDDAADGLFVARNGARGKNHAVALAERHIGMLIERDTRQRGARLTLAPGTKRHHLIGRQIPIDIGAAKFLDAVEIAGFARDLDDALHGTANHDDLAATRPRRERHGPQARDI